jgi:hypothetical protein
MTVRIIRLTAVAALMALVCQTALVAQRGGRGAVTPRAAAPFDLTGQWVSLITEDWRHRQFTPPKGDFPGLPLTPAARKAADSWDPARDDAANEQCRAFGAAGLMRLPTRLRVSWLDDMTLKVDADAGTQTRLLHFGQTQSVGGDWQGVSAASWDAPQSPMGGRGGLPRGGSLKVVTTKMRPGYLRRNGVPYGANAVMTEYFDRLDLPGGDALIVVTTEIVDPEYLSQPYWTSQQFKRETDQTRWRPTPCSAR